MRLGEGTGPDAWPRRDRIPKKKAGKLKGTGKRTCRSIKVATLGLRLGNIRLPLQEDALLRAL